MASNLAREAQALLGEILGLEEHLRAHTAPRDGGWGTASPGERRDQRQRLRALRRRLRMLVEHLVPAARAELDAVLAHDRVIHGAYLALQLKAAAADSDRIAFPPSGPEAWAKADPD